MSSSTEEFYDNARFTNPVFESMSPERFDDRAKGSFGKVLQCCLLPPFRPLPTSNTVTTRELAPEQERSTESRADSTVSRFVRRRNTVRPAPDWLDVVEQIGCTLPPEQGQMNSNIALSRRVLHDGAGPQQEDITLTGLVGRCY